MRLPSHLLSRLSVLVLVSALAISSNAAPLGTAFTYQGWLQFDGQAANGLFDFVVCLYETPVGEPDIDCIPNLNQVPIEDGLFTLALDFQEEFQGQATYLELRVRSSDTGGAYTPLLPRQAVRPAPEALHAAQAAFARVTPWSGISNKPPGLDGSVNVAALAQTVAQLEAALAQAQARIEALEQKTAALSVEPDKLIVEGVNLHIRSGAGSTNAAPNGRGNLILGYDEARPSGSDKSGSHNLVLGMGANYSRYSGIVGGQNNTISANYAMVLSGAGNVASGDWSMILTGAVSRAELNTSVVVSGEQNVADGARSVVLGGRLNRASGALSVVVGGRQNAIDHSDASIGGGQNQTSTAASRFLAQGQIVQ